MAPRKNDTPSVATFADHEVITPPHALRKAITPAPDGGDDPVARAEAALEELAGEFAGWMHAECDRLEAARHELRRGGMSKKTHNELFRAAHDIKGEAATFGYPAVAPVADSPMPIRRPGDCPRTCPRRPRRHGQRSQQAVAGRHRRVPARRKYGPAGLSRKYIRPAACPRRGLSPAHFMWLH